MPVLPIPITYPAIGAPKHLEKWVAQFPKKTRFWGLPALSGQDGIVVYSKGVLDTVYLARTTKCGKKVTAAAQHVQGIRKRIAGHFARGTVTIRGIFVLVDKYRNKEWSIDQLEQEIKDRLLTSTDPKSLRQLTFIATHYQSDHRKVKITSRYQEFNALGFLGFTSIRNPARYSKGYYRLKKIAKKDKSLRMPFPVFARTHVPGLVIEGTPDKSWVKAATRECFSSIPIDQIGLWIEPCDHQLHKMGKHGGTPKYALIIKPSSKWFK